MATTALFESIESSSPGVTRAVSAGLRDEYCDALQLPGWQRAALRFLGGLPQAWGSAAIERFQALSGLSPTVLDGLAVDDLAAARLRDYAVLNGPFPAVAIGAALGGATAHLALALGAPFLPQAFVVTLRGGAPDGDVRAYFRRSAELARQIAAQNPGVLTIQHYDPVHDGWLTRRANHLRFKLLDVPTAHIQFIRRNLAPGGAVVYLDCSAPWLRYRVGERSVFQVGGWGGIPPEEFLEGSERLARYARSIGLKHSAWKLPGYPLERGPESEWGCEPAFGAALEAFCRVEGYRFVRIALPAPHDFSRLAFLAAGRLLQAAGRAPTGALVETFTQFDATAARLGDLLPLWLVFNTQDSLAFLQAMTPHFPTGRPVFFSPLATFSRTPDLVPWPAWAAALDGLAWTNIGARPGHYPGDARALVDWAKPLRRWVAGQEGLAHSHSGRGRISAEELQGLAAGLTGV